MAPKHLSIGIDYLQGMARFSEFRQLESFLEEVQAGMVTGDKCFFDQEGVTIGRKFNNRIRSVKGLWGGFTVHDDYIDCHLQFPGTICWEFTDQLKSLELIKERLKKLTRIDIAIDDEKRRISQKKIQALAEKKHYKGLDSFKFIESKAVKGEEPIGTCIFGSSEKIVKFYNAEFMHGIPADRWELLLRGDYAEFCADEIIEKRDIRAGGKFLTGTLDFIKPGSNSNHDKRYRFWEQFVKEIGQCRLRKPRDEPTLERALDWLERQAGPTFAVMYFGLGQTEFTKSISRIAERSSERLQEHHLAWINYLQEQREQPYA
ncbi:MULTISPECIES: replication initiation factor domain-containing protein [unclassified Synechocystis]|uniref:replication initiation factor domain-containing protein n=1 Tax=unclassified Synechocystis TaxID=2640012 RepID=UPI0004147AFC|nr:MULTISPECIES: replication initiation factor domain-containing protein [unclassified Synechocystis]AIE73846.1 hypothetical protein D082_13180 [Synechocystis sp. PCC 6714]MCT0252340.1 replication initiation factor domain-containing protein [Synechocystis sp. CS-94]